MVFHRSIIIIIIISTTTTTKDHNNLFFVRHGWFYWEPLLWRRNDFIIILFKKKKKTTFHFKYFLLHFTSLYFLLFKFSILFPWYMNIFFCICFSLIYLFFFNSFIDFFFYVESFLSISVIHLFNFFSPFFMNFLRHFKNKNQFLFISSRGILLSYQGFIFLTTQASISQIFFNTSGFAYAYIVWHKIKIPEHSSWIHLGQHI